jgi:hypothetical protein
MLLFLILKYKGFPHLDAIHYSICMGKLRSHILLRISLLINLIHVLDEQDASDQLPAIVN